MDLDDAPMEWTGVDYPDPRAATNTPYPTLTTIENANRTWGSQQLPHSPGSSAQQMVPPSNFFGLSSSAIAGANEYQKLVASFQLRHGDPKPAGEDPTWTLQALDDVAKDPGTDNTLDEVQGAPIANRYLNLNMRNKPDRAWDAAYHLGSDDAAAPPEVITEDMIETMEDESLGADQDRSSPEARQRGSGKRGRGQKRSRGWKWALKGTAHDPNFDPPRVGRPRGSGNKRGRPRGSNTGKMRMRDRPDPGAEFKTFQTQANAAYMDGDLDAALHYARLAVQANAEEYAAHSLISQILEARGEFSNSLAALITGANTCKDPSVWIMCAEKTLDLAGDDPTQAELEQALFCYSEAVEIDSKNYDARMERMRLNVELKNWRRADDECRALFKLRPNQLEIPRLWAEVITNNYGPTSFRIEEVKNAYGVAFDALLKQGDTGLEPSELWSQLNVYMDMMDRFAAPEHAIAQLKTIARWILGRKDEPFWDTFVSDDREFDISHERRVYCGEYQQGKASRDLELYGSSLPLELRIKFGMFRLKLGHSHREEAARHFDVIYQLRDNMEDYCDFFWDVADRLKDIGWTEKAIEFYEACREVSELLDNKFWLSLATCYRRLGRLDDAEECYQYILSIEDTNMEAIAGLAKVYEILGRLEESRSYANRARSLGYKEALLHERVALPTMSRKAPSARATAEKPEPGRKEYDARPLAPRPSSEQQAGATIIEMPPPKRQRTARPSEVELVQRTEKQQERVAKCYITLKQALGARDNNESAMQVWIDSALSLCEEFQSMRVFFPKEKARFKGYGKIVYKNPELMSELEQLTDRLSKGEGEATDEANVDDATVHLDFHGVPFFEWHRIFVELALVLAQRGEKEKCYALLDVTQTANVFYFNQDLQATTNAAKLCAGLMFNDDEMLIRHLRDIVMAGDMVSGEAHQLFAAINRLVFANTEFRDSSTQKWFLRLIKQLDFPHLPEEYRRFTENSGNNQFSTKHKIARLEATGFTDHQLDAGALLMYGHMISLSNHSAGSMAYYFRALALDPENPTINLSIAITRVQNAMKSPNSRQKEIVQGLAFLYRYYELRTASGKASHFQEAEFNVARCWHMLGLTDLAIDRYEKVLQLSGQLRKEHAEEMLAAGDDVEDYAPEAALALREIFALVGNNFAANAITEKWLVL